MEYTDRLASVNLRLTRVKLRVKGDRLYLRGTFPPKPGGDRPKQAEIATGYRAIASELKLAEGFAREIEGQLIREKFDWVPFLKPSEKPPERVGEWLTRIEADWWAKKLRTDNSLDHWKTNYKAYFDKLPQEKSLTVALLKTTIEERSKPASRSRECYCLAYGLLAKFAGLDPSEIKPARSNYKPPKCTIDSLPTDGVILASILAIENPAWRYMFGLQAAFGLRNHELFRLDLNRLSDGVVRVSENSKTGTRLAWACPLEWVSLFDLANIAQRPRVIIEGKSNRALGSTVTRAALDLKLPCTPYSLRDAYAIRLAVAGVDVAIAAQWMGHSVSVHCKHYLDALQERHSQEIFSKLNMLP